MYFWCIEHNFHIILRTPFSCNGLCDNKSVVACLSCALSYIFGPWLVLRKKKYKVHFLNRLGPLIYHRLTLITTWIINCMHYDGWNEITFPFFEIR